MARLTTRARVVALLAPLTLAALLPALAVPSGAATSPTAVRTLTRADLFRLAASDRAPAARAARQAEVAAEGSQGRTLPSFSGSFTTDGVTYPYTMLGADPSSGRTVRLKTVVVPIRVVFTGFDQKATFDPAFAVQNMLDSPLYRPARFVNGTGQFTDLFQRAQFWSSMDAGKRWHTLLAEPEVARTRTVTVTPDVAQLDSLDGALLGNVDIDVWDAHLHAILPSLHLAADETPLFVSQSVTADALGYHDAFLVPDGRRGRRVQTLMWSSWLAEAQVGPLLADVSTLNHEVAEWVDDPFVDNEAPLWAFPPAGEVCGDNPFLEVGDPIGNGPDFDLFPTIPVRLNKFTYHLQNLSFLQWFSRESPSSAYKGWYSYPDPTQITTPSVDCPPVPAV
jgi:hypothetical protein